MGTKIFISYRRDDDPYAARGINEALCKQFGKRRVYFDLDTMQAVTARLKFWCGYRLMVSPDFRAEMDDLLAIDNC